MILRRNGLDEGGLPRLARAEQTDDARLRQRADDKRPDVASDQVHALRIASWQIGSADAAN
jgi:hypothetical protein